MLTNASFRDIVLREFAEEPMRYLQVLVVLGRQSYAFARPAQTTYYCLNNDDFSRRMRLGRVGKLQLSSSANFDKNFFKVLLPLKNAWRGGHIDTMLKFASQSLCERTFSELLFCKSMLVVVSARGRLRHPFLSFPAVRECTSLDVYQPPGPLTVVEILAWLNVDAHFKQPKRLEMGVRDLKEGVENLVEQLKKDFSTSKMFHRYTVKIKYVWGYNGQLGRFVNTDTAEKLVIGHSAAARSIEMERKPMDGK